MNFNQLKYIVSLDTHRSFSRAAEECEVAQSTLSKEVQRLEKEFDVIIFDRTRYPIVPTIKGLELISIAQNIIRLKKEFVDVALKKDNAPAGNFNLGILPGLAPYLLPLFTGNLTKKYPDLHLKIFEMSQYEMADALVQEKIDAGLSISPFYKDGFYEEFLFEEHFVLYLNENHALAKKTKVNWNEIPLEELILQDEIKSFLLTKDELKQILPHLDSKIKNVAFENGSLETIRKIIDVNGGLTLLPHLSTYYMGKRRLKMVREIQAPKLSRKICMILARGFEKNRINKVIKKEIINSLPKD